MALKVEIDASQGKLENVEVRNGTKNGYDWEIRSQEIWVYISGDKYPQKVTLALPDSVKVYPMGNYELDMNQGFSVGNFKAPIVDNRKLFLTQQK